MYRMYSTDNLKYERIDVTKILICNMYTVIAQGVKYKVISYWLLVVYFYYIIPRTKVSWSNMYSTAFIDPNFPTRITLVIVRNKILYISQRLLFMFGKTDLLSR